MANINTKEMLKFYEKFDSINFKYSLDEKYKDEKKYVEIYGKLESIESAKQFTELTKVEYGDILTNLDLIYAREEQSDQIVMLFDLIRNKIINQYINIDGLERLFSEKYIDFEWDMHLGIDYKKHKMKFYRDHFVHQIRNAFSMHILLEQFQFKEKIEKTLKDQNNSKISQYVCKYIEQQKVRGYYNDKEGMSCYNNDEFYFKNIIYMSSYMSALFHDIGYPEAHNTVNQKRITEYIANLYSAESSGYNYLRLNALLQNSLLFRVVPFEEIQKRLSGNKPDHGVLSAIIFLLNFYENGAIHGLPSYKRCAVELAALAIYNHTNKYCYNAELNEGDYVRCVFTLNPISYLLRLCDDLQEWGRIYFELSNRSNLIVCNTCKTPIVRKKFLEKMVDCGGSVIKYYYACNCNYVGSEGKEIEKIAKQGVFYPVFEYSRNFPYRRIYNVMVCENLQVEDKNQVLCFCLEYDLAKLLHIAYINPDYAKYRIKELNQFKRLLDFQKELPEMKILYFMTANPILIKTQIVSESFGKNIRLQQKLDKLYTLYEETFRVDNAEEADRKLIIWESEFHSIANDLQMKMNDIIQEVYPKGKDYLQIVKSVEMAGKLYLQLMIFMAMYQRCNQNRCPDKVLLNEAKRVWKDMGSQSDEVHELVADSWKQFSRMYLDIRKIKSNPENYYLQFMTSDYTYGCIKRYVSADNYVPVLEKGGLGIDAFTDLKLIQTLLERM